MRRMNAGKMLATRNYKHGQFKDFDMLSGETLAEKHLIKNAGCVTCPIHCSRIVEVDGKQVKGPELETLTLLGSNLDNNDLEAIMRWNVQLDELGMDTISMGNVIGFAMELQEKGLWDSGLEFGKTENLPGVFEDIAYRRGIGDLLAEGTRSLAEKFGGKEFAIHAKGLEFAAYEPRGAVGQGLGYATSNRGGCHLNSGFPALIEGLGLRVNPYTPKSKAALTVLNQNLMEAVSAGGNCLFALFTFYDGWLVDHPGSVVTKSAMAVVPFTGAFVNILNKIPGKFVPIHLPMLPNTAALSAVTGMKIRLGELKDIGERGYNLERMLNVKLGITEKDDTLPARLTDELQTDDEPRSRVPLETMKREYYRIRGWAPDGIPGDAKKRQLGLA